MQSKPLAPSSPEIGRVITIVIAKVGKAKERMVRARNRLHGFRPRAERVAGQIHTLRVFLGDAPLQLTFSHFQ